MSNKKLTPEEYYDTLMEVKTYLPSVGLTPFALAMPKEYIQGSAVESYRTYYLEDKWYIGQWAFGSPDWWPNDHIIKKQKEEKRRLYLQNEKLKKIQMERLK